MDYATIKSYYDEGLWTDKMVRKAVSLGYITSAQYTTITGKTY